MSDDRTVTRSSGNVFADAGLPDAHTQLVKAQLVSRIDAIIGERGLSQREAARILDIAQPDLSNILRGRFRGYSVERRRPSIEFDLHNSHIMMTGAKLNSVS